MNDNSLEVQVRGDSSNLTSALDTAEASLLSFQGAVGAAGAALATFSGVALAGAITAAADFEEAMIGVQRVTDEVTAAQLSEGIQEIAANAPVAAGELATIAETGGRLGIQGAEDIETFTMAVVKLSTATNLTADQAAEDFARLSNALDVPISKMENMGSAVNTLSQTTAASTADIVGSMTRAAPAAAQLGVRFEEVAAMSATLVSAGQGVERSGSRLNRAFTKLAQSVPEVAEATGMTADEFRRLIEDNPTEALLTYLDHLNSIDSQTARVSEATELFGEAGAKAILSLASNQEDLEAALGDSNEQFEEATSLQREYDLALDTLNARTQILQNRIGNAGREIGANFLPAVKDVVTVVADGAAGFNELNRATDGLVGSFTLVTGAAIGTAAVLRHFTPVAGTPVGLAIAGIGALSIAWSRNMFGIRDTTARVADDVGSILGRTMGGLSSTTNEELDTQIGYWKRWEITIAAGLDWIGTKFTNLVDSITTGTGVIGEYLSGTADIIEAAAAGNTEEATRLSRELVGTREERFSALSDRLSERNRGMELRMADRRGALAQDDPSLLPGSDTSPSALEEALEKNREDQAAWERKREDQEEEHQRTLSAILGANEQTANTLAGSAITGSRCELRDHLLEPFERAPRPATPTFPRQRPQEEREEKIIRIMERGNELGGGDTSPEVYMNGRKVSEEIESERTQQLNEQVVQ